MAVVKVRLHIDKSRIGKMQQKAIDGLFALGFDIASQARANAPYVSGALRNSIRVEPDGEDVLVKAGGTVAPLSGGGSKMINYAYKREIGPNRFHSTEHYMENAQKQIMSGDYLKEYFGDIAK